MQYIITHISGSAKHCGEATAPYQRNSNMINFRKSAKLIVIMRSLHRDLPPRLKVGTTFHKKLSFEIY